MSGRRNGKLGIALAGGFAEFERAMIPERTSAGLAAGPRRGAHRRSTQEA
jgi:DNA invertase Pin-like site-specific DNA recombinase